MGYDLFNISLSASKSHSNYGYCFSVFDLCFELILRFIEKNQRSFGDCAFERRNRNRILWLPLFLLHNFCWAICFALHCKLLEETSVSAGTVRNSRVKACRKTFVTTSYSAVSWFYDRIALRRVCSWKVIDGGDSVAYWLVICEICSNVSLFVNQTLMVNIIKNIILL